MNIRQCNIQRLHSAHAQACLVQQCSCQPLLARRLLCTAYEYNIMIYSIYYQYVNVVSICEMLVHFDAASVTKCFCSWISTRCVNHQSWIVMCSILRRIYAFRQILQSILSNKVKRTFFSNSKHSGDAIEPRASAASCRTIAFSSEFSSTDFSFNVA